MNRIVAIALTVILGFIGALVANNIPAPSPSYDLSQGKILFKSLIYGIGYVICFIPCLCMWKYTRNLSPKRKFIKLSYYMKNQIEEYSKQWANNDSIQKSEKIKIMQRCIKTCSVRLKMFMQNYPNYKYDDVYLVQFIKKLQILSINDSEFSEEDANIYINTFNSFYDYLCGNTIDCPVRFKPNPNIETEYKTLLNSMKLSIEEVYKRFLNDITIDKRSKINIMHDCIKSCEIRLREFMTNNPRVFDGDSYIVKFMKYFKDLVENGNIPETHYDAYIKIFDEFYKYLIW